MEQGGVPRKRTTVTQRGLLPVRVSHGAFFHVRYSGKSGDASENAFIAHTYASVRTLLATANCATPAVYFCSRTVGGDMAVRRVTTVRHVPHTDVCVIDFEDGRGVLWDESEHLGATSFYLDVGAPLSVSQLANIATQVASTRNAEREPNDAGRGGD